MAHIVIVMGGPGAGKSTLCAGLARRFERAMHLEVDVIRHSMVSGFTFPQPPFDGETAVQFGLARRSVEFMALTYADADVDFVIDDAAIPSNFREQYGTLFDDPRTTPVLLNPGGEVLLDRIRLRQGPHDEQLLQIPAAAFDHENDAIDTTGWLVIDDPAISPEATVELVYRHLLSRAGL